MLGGDTSTCLNLQFSHLQQPLMPRQMDKIRVNVCEELPKGSEQLLDVNNRMKCSEMRERTEGKWTKTAGSDKEKQLVVRNESSVEKTGGAAATVAGIMTALGSQTCLQTTSRSAENRKKGSIINNKYFCLSDAVNIKSTGVLGFPQDTAAFIFLLREVFRLSATK